MSRHHRKCKANGGKNNKKNISIVSKVKHRSYHNLFGTMNAFEIADELNKHWIDPAHEIIAVPKRATLQRNRL